MKAFNFFIGLMFLMVFSAFAQKSIPNFSLKNATDGSDIALSSMSNQKAVVVIFTSNYCPFSKLYENRIKALANNFADKGVSFVLINSNRPEDNSVESIEDMATKAKELGWNFPYLADKDQKVMALFGATKSPEVFVLKPAGNQFNLLYSGAIDDNPQVETDVRERYLKDAIEAILAGRNPARPSMRATGCIIKN